MGRIEWGGELIWAVGFTSGGAPFGLRVCDFCSADLEAMRLDIAAAGDTGAATGKSDIEKSDHWPRDDIPF